MTYLTCPDGLVWRGAVPVVLVLLVIVGTGAPRAAQYERAPSFTASQVLPPSLLRSPNYKIENRVALDNFQYSFKVQTQWGTFPVKGTALLRVRAKEIAATEKLEEIDAAGTLVNAAGRTALKPLGTAKGLLTQPVKTLDNTFKGIGNLLGSVDASMEATDPHKAGILASLTGGAAARRKLAYDFGVDPNTSFAPLSEELTRLATANALGETSSNVGFAFVTGGAGIAISATGTSQLLREALRDKTAAQLEQKGRQFLAEMRVTGAPVEAFYANPNLSPTDKAVIVVALRQLGDVGGREIFIAGTGRAKSIEMGFFFRRQAVLIAKFNKKVSPVRRFVQAGEVPMIETGKGTISVLPVDYLYWTQPLAVIAERVGRGGEIWLTGRASKMATAKLAALGLKVVPKVGPRLD